MPARKPSAMTPDKLRAIRTEIGVTQSVMAAMLGMTLQGYQKLEQGDRPINLATARLAYLLTVKKNRDLLLEVG